MYSKLLDDQTLSEVIAAAPLELDEAERVARLALVELARETTATVLAQVNWIGPVQVYELSMKALTEKLGGKHTPHLVGRAVHELGLKSMRRRDGFYVLWTRKQIEILRSYLGV